MPIQSQCSRLTETGQSEQTLSVVIPVFNEERGLDALLSRLMPVLEECGLAWETIFVDDGSTDDTLARLRAIHASESRVKVVSFSRNFGKEVAAAAGLRYASGDAVVLMDGDLQHPPELLPQMLAMWKSGRADLVEAIKDNRGNESALHRLGSRVFYSILSVLAGQDLRNASDFKLMDRRVVEAWQRMGEHGLFFRGMVAWLGFERRQIHFSVPDRVGGSSAWTFVKLLKLATNAVTAFSSSPLQIVTFLGVAFFVFAGMLGAQTLYNWYAGDAVSGFTTVILLVLMVGAVQMVCIGILGAYVARIYEEVKGRPRYVVKERTH